MINYTNSSCIERGFEDTSSYSGSVLWIVINTLIIILTVFGNILTISAILLSRKLNSFIANQFVFSLAVSDLLVGLSIPYHMLFYLVHGFGDHKLKCVLRFALLTFACASSIWNLLLIATDRYFAIVYPLHYIRYMTRKLSLIMIGFIWLTSLGMALTLFSWNNWETCIQCEIVKVMPSDYMNFVVTPMFATVWFIMTMLYARICKEASANTKRIRNTKNLQTMQVHKTMKDSKSFKVMLAILGCFSICWLPFFIETLYARVKNETSMFYEISFTLAVANSGINPIIYAWKNSNFRQAFLSLMKCRLPNNATGSNYITNHVPSKKNSLNTLNGICNGNEAEDVIRGELDIELQKSSVVNDVGNGVQTDITNTNNRFGANER